MAPGGPFRAMAMARRLQNPGTAPQQAPAKKAKKAK
jgi:hypothetical protein